MKDNLSIPARKALLALRWDKVASRARQADWGRTGLGTLATKFGLEWYRVRGDEPVVRFIALAGGELLELHGFGRSKIGRLCEIVERAVDDLGADCPEVMVESSNLLEALVDWEIPTDFPCRLIMLPIRVQNYCSNLELESLGQLLAAWEELGFDGFDAQKNLGVKSVRRLETLVNALRDLDHGTASLFLPLDLAGRGLSLGLSLRQVALDLNPSERSMLTRRLVERMTLEESAEESGLTRERIRQVEAKFLNELRERLDYFSKDYALLLGAWVSTGAWFESLRSNGPAEGDAFLAAALEAIFRDTPQAVARALGEESRLECWHEQLFHHPDLWFGGVSLSEFLESLVPIPEQQLFCEHVAGSSTLRVDHADGRVYPARIGLRKSVAAMLAAEDDPIPLTWLVELLYRSGYHLTASRDKLLRYRAVWLRREGFPKDMILWDE